MSQKKGGLRYLIWAIPLCMLVSFLAVFFLNNSIKREITKELIGVQFVVESNAAFNSTLYYSHSNSFLPENKLPDINNARDTLLFHFPKGKDSVKRFRLDFGSDQRLKKVKIRASSVLYENRVVSLGASEIFERIYLNSPSTSLVNTNLEIEMLRSSVPFDPYIVFLPVVEFNHQNWLYVLACLAPFILLLLGMLLYHRKEYKVTILDVLIFLLILSIPLKIAWTSFCVILLCIYGLLDCFRKRTISFKNWNFIFFCGLFLLLVVFGRPDSFKDVSKELSLLFIGIIAVTLKLNTIRVYWLYSLFFLFFQAILVTSILAFLFWFDEFYGLTAVDYFNEIKIYSGKARDWIVYYHATFLSFFGLVGLLFIKRLTDLNKIDKGVYVFYHVLLVLFIVLVGSRICLLLYVVYLVNILLKLNFRSKVISNLIFFVFAFLMILSQIKNIDVSRASLWEISRNAIVEKPWLGYGLDESKEVLCNQNYIKQEGAHSPLELNHSHNQYFTSLIEIGFLGSLAIVLWTIVFLRKSSQWNNSLLFLFILGLLYVFVTESILQTSKPLYIICFLFLLSISENRSNSFK